jgi:hypothetical protein
MKYKKKLIVLTSIIIFLAMAYILGLIFSPDRMNTRSTMYTWLEPTAAESAEKITLWNNGESVDLIRKNGAWLVSTDNKEYPAKQMRVADLLGILSRRGSFPVRAGSTSAYERLGLDESAASRITVSGTKGQTLLDLIVGHGDATGQNIFLRKHDSNEIRSGEDKISVYLYGGQKSWYNLKLVPENENNQLDIDKVQRVTIYASGDSDGSAPQIFTRKARRWTYNKTPDGELDMDKVDRYIRGVLYAEGDDFNTELSSVDPLFGNSRIIIEYDNGIVKTIYISAAIDDEERHYAIVSGSDLVYSLAEWMANRLFFTADYFRKEE